MKLDVLVLSSSRPHLLWMTLRSFQQKCKNVSLRFCIDDDVVNKAMSKLITKTNMEYNGEKLDIMPIKYRLQPIGPFIKYNRFANECKDKYFMILEDDWQLQKEVDILALIRIMDSDSSVNQLMLTYNPEPIASPEVHDMYAISLRHRPCAHPSIWRTAHMKSKSNHPEIKHMWESTPFVKLRIPSLIIAPDGGTIGEYKKVLGKRNMNHSREMKLEHMNLKVHFG